MLGTLVAAVNAAQSGLYYALYGSYKTGFILVTLLKTLFSYLSVIFENLATIFLTFSESFSIFLQDILQCLQNLINAVLSSVEVLTTNTSILLLGFFTLIANLTSTITSFYNGLFNAIWNFLTNIGQIFILAKKLIVLLGSGIWFAITLIPILMFYFMKLSLIFVQTVALEICQLITTCIFSSITVVKNLILFTIDVPVESFFGLVIAISLLYILVQFYVLIYRNLAQVWHKFKFILRRLKNRLWTTMEQMLLRSQNQIVYRRQIRQNQTPQTQERPVGRPTIRKRPETRLQRKNNLNKSILEMAEDKFCVICQERNKCILLLPCRHVCLCSECNQELRYYNDVCPICRTDIESTMKIFV